MQTINFLQQLIVQANDLFRENCFFKEIAIDLLSIIVLVLILFQRKETNEIKLKKEKNNYLS